MSNSDAFGTYLRELQKNLSTGAATEHTHRSAMAEIDALIPSWPIE
jgi:hypothetical protein